MAASQGTVRFHQDAQAVTFQVVGWGTMKCSLPVRRCAEAALCHGVKWLRVDLRHCRYMDSTFLGTLLFLKRLIERRETGSFALISPSPQCRQLLRQMGLEKILAAIDAEELAPNDWIELKSGSGDLTEFKRNVVQAHQELGRLDGPAGETFRVLATELAQELNSENAEGEKKQK